MNRDNILLKHFPGESGIFDVNRCMAECKKNEKCKGFALGYRVQSIYAGQCILYGLDREGNECIKLADPHWVYYSLKDCSSGVGDMITMIMKNHKP